MNFQPEVKGLITVVVPVYNVEKYVGECLESLVAQEDTNFELIIVDDGSTDSCAFILSTYVDRFDKIRIVRQENRGLGGARNTGVNLAVGEFITFVDSDDIVAPEYVSALRGQQEAGNYDVVSSNFELMSERGELLPSQSGKNVASSSHYDVLGAHSISVAWGRLYRRKLLLQPGVSFPEHIPNEDLFFTYKVLKLSKASFTIPDSIYYWRQRQGSLGKSITPVHIGVLPRLRVDTNEFLLDKSAAPEEYVLAARRNLSLLPRFRNKVTRYGPECLPVFWDMFAGSLVEIQSEVNLLTSSNCGDLDLLNRVDELLQQFEGQADGTADPKTSDGNSKTSGSRKEQTRAEPKINGAASPELPSATLDATAEDVPEPQATTNHSPPELEYAAYRDIALQLKNRNPLLFRLGQTANWVMKAANSHRVGASLICVTVVGLVALPLFASSLWPWRSLFWLVGAFFVFSAIAGSIVREAFARVLAFQQESLAEIRSHTRKNSSVFARNMRLEKQWHQRELTELNERLITQIGDLEKSVDGKLARISKDLRAGDKSVQNSFSHLHQHALNIANARNGSQFSALRKELTVSSESRRHSEEAIRKELSALGARFRSDITELESNLTAEVDEISDQPF